MALPLAATLQPIEQPFLVGAEAEMLMVYPGATAEDVTLDFYLDLQESAVAVYPTGYIYTTGLPGCLPPGLDECAVPITDVGMPGWVSITGLSTLSFTWLDVAAFFWFDPAGTPADDPTPPGGGPDPIPPIGQPCPPGEVQFCLPGSTPLAPTLDDSVCPPGAVVWADTLDPWDSGLTCWDAPV